VTRKVLWETLVLVITYSHWKQSSHGLSGESRVSKVSRKPKGVVKTMHSGQRSYMVSTA